MQNKVVIVSAVRTPLGCFMGSLSNFSAVDLGIYALEGALSKIDFDRKKIDELIVGHVLQSGCGQAPAKQIALGAKLRPEIPCSSVNKVCSSGLKAVNLAAQSIQLGINEVVENNIKRVELVFYPSTTEDLPKNNNNETSVEQATPAIVLTSAEFNVVSEQDNDTGETKEVLQPIEDSFSIGKLLDLEDIDISKNQLRNGDIIMYDESKEKFVIGEAAVVNNSNQTLLEVLSEQPQKFNLVNSNATSGLITLEWNYDDIIVNYDDNTYRLLSKGEHLKDKMIPYIDKIHVDISGTIHGNTNNVNNNNWIPYNIGDYDNDGNRSIINSDSYNSSSYKILNINKTQSSSLTGTSTLIGPTATLPS